jgi:hypothetical protein
MLPVTMEKNRPSQRRGSQHEECLLAHSRCRLKREKVRPNFVSLERMESRPLRLKYLLSYVISFLCLLVRFLE